MRSGAAAPAYSRSPALAVRALLAYSRSPALAVRAAPAYSRSPALAVRALGGAAILLAGSSAAAAPPKLTANDYSVELFQGPLIAPTRVLGLAGAFTGYAEGIDAVESNAAAPAVREPYSAKWFDYDIALSLSFPGSFSKTDFDNRGRKGDGTTQRFDNFLDLNLGLLLQFGELAVTVTSDLQKFDLASASPSSGVNVPGQPGLTLEVARWHALAAYGLLGNQVVVGAGARIATTQILQAGGFFGATQIIGSGSVLTMAGAAPEVGILIKPNNASFRLGGTLRAPVSAGVIGTGHATVDAMGVHHVGEFILPTSIVQPWEADIGVAIQVGPRPINPAWLDPHLQEAPLRDKVERERDQRARVRDRRLAQIADLNERKQEEARLLGKEQLLRDAEDAQLEAASERLLAERRARYDNWPRERLLLVGSVLLTGPSHNAVAVEAFLDQVNEPYGTSLSVSPRAGIEAEPWVGRLIARAGSYVEPSRFASGSFRQHFTIGSEIRLTEWDAFGIIKPTMFKLNLAADVAPRYTNWSVGFGVWH